jgi:hypothetical protein
VRAWTIPRCQSAPPPHPKKMPLPKHFKILNPYTDPSLDLGPAAPCTTPLQWRGAGPRPRLLLLQHPPPLPLLLLPLLRPPRPPPELPRQVGEAAECGLHGCPGHCRVQALLHVHQVLRGRGGEGWRGRGRVAELSWQEGHAGLHEDAASRGAGPQRGRGGAERRVARPVGRPQSDKGRRKRTWHVSTTTVRGASSSARRIRSWKHVGPSRAMSTSEVERLKRKRPA